MLDCISKHLLLSESDLLYEKQIRQSLCPLQLILGDRKKKKKSKGNLFLQLALWIE